MCYMHLPFSGGSRGGYGEGGGSSEPPFETKLFHFHGEFSEKSGKKGGGALRQNCFIFMENFSEISGKINEKSGKVNK